MKYSFLIRVEKVHFTIKLVDMLYTSLSLWKKFVINSFLHFILNNSYEIVMNVTNFEGKLASIIFQPF